MATFSASATVTAKMTSIVFNADGSFLVSISLTRADGTSAGGRHWLVKTDQTCTDVDSGTLVANNVPTGFLNNLASIATTADTLINTAAGAGKITL